MAADRRCDMQTLRAMRRRAGLARRAADWFWRIRGGRLPEPPAKPVLDMNRIRRIAYL